MIKPKNMSFLFELTLKPRNSYFTWQQYQGFFIGTFIDSKSFQRAKIILLWPRNKTICLIKEFMFLGLWTSHADKWGQGPRFFRQNGSAMDPEQFESRPPVMLGPPSIFALVYLPWSMLSPPKGEVALSSCAVPAHSFPWQSNWAASQSHTVQESWDPL